MKRPRVAEHLSAIVEMSSKPLIQVIQEHLP